MFENQPRYVHPRSGPAHLCLGGAWNFSWADKPLESSAEIVFEHTATLPRSVYGCLHEAGILPDPYVGTNSHQYRWVDEKVWYFRRQFAVDQPDFAGNAYLCFDGVAYFCRVWINGHLCSEHEGMFGGPVVDIAPWLNKNGNNELIVEVVGATHERAYSFRNEKGENTQIVPWNIVRDNATSNGDFHVLGIWNRVRLELLNGTHLGRPHLVTNTIEEGAAHLSLGLEIATPQINELAPYPIYQNGYTYTFSFEHGFTGALRPESVTLEVTLREKTTGKVAYSTRHEEPLIDYPRSRIKEAVWEPQYVNLDILLENPTLWYPLGMGDPFLYTVEVAMYDGDRLLDSLTFDTGIRTLTVERNPGRQYAHHWGKFLFKVNGKPFFVKGMNWQPLDFLYSIDEAEYRWALELVKKAGIQLLRVWSGGGMPETDTFYRLCDEMGILVWQDQFPANMDHTETWPQEVLEAQIAYNLYRIRTHPSLAVHCGGNEFNPFAKGNAAGMFIIRRIIEALDPERPFFYASPLGGSGHIYKDMDPAWYRHLFGDLCFMAESGIHSFPAYETLKKLLSAEEISKPLPDLSDPSFREQFPELLNHFSEYEPARVPRMMARASQIDDMKGITLEGMCLATQAQAHEFYTTMLHAMRENFPRTGGVMPWVFKRPWPTVGIQIVDGDGQPTLPYYAVKNAYAPLAVSLRLPYTVMAPGESLPLQAALLNDLQLPTEGLRLRLTVYDPGLQPALVKKQAIGNDTAWDLGVFQPGEEYVDRYFLLCMDVTDGETVVTRTTYTVKCVSLLDDPTLLAQHRANPTENLYLAEGPWLKPQVAGSAHTTLTLTEAVCRRQDKTVTVTLTVTNTGDAPAYPVMLTAAGGRRYVAEDSYFLLQPGESRRLWVTVDDTAGKVAVTAAGWNTEQVTIEI